MNPKVLFIGSIGTIAETSELQRQAYNQALKENDVNWEWSKETYKKLLKSNGGQDRLQTLSEATNTNLSNDTIKAIHARKTELAGDLIKKHNIKPRPGIAQLITDAKENGTKVAWVTTTGTENTDAILDAFDGAVSRDHFDHIFHRSDAENGKPSPEIYHAALKHFKAEPKECIAVEDSLNSALAAKHAGIFTVVTPGEYHNEVLDNIANVELGSLEQTNWDFLTQQYENA